MIFPLFLIDMFRTSWFLAWSWSWLRDLTAGIYSTLVVLWPITDWSRVCIWIKDKVIWASKFVWYTIAALPEVVYKKGMQIS